MLLPPLVCYQTHKKLLSVYSLLSLFNAMIVSSPSPSILSPVCLMDIKQEALLPQTDRATRYVSRNLVNC